MPWFVALAEAAALTVTVVAFAGLLRAQQRAHVRREDLLVNQLLHAAGKPWTPPPADQGIASIPSRAEIMAGYTTSPDRYDSE